MDTINFWPILISSVVSFGISTLWYSPFLFGKDWTNLIKIDDKDMGEMKVNNVWRSYIIHFIVTLISFVVLGFAIKAVGIDTASNGAFVGFLAWLGFIIPIAVSDILWKKQPIKLALIETVDLLVTLVIGGAIIGAWR
jgi:hypothetical protein